MRSAQTRTGDIANGVRRTEHSRPGALLTCVLRGKKSARKGARAKGGDESAGKRASAVTHVLHGAQLRNERERARREEHRL